MSDLHTTTNAYLVNMAIADLIYVDLNGALGFALPYMMSPIKIDVHYGQIGCIFRATVGNMCYYTSFILVTCVAVERFLAICYPLYQQVVNCKSYTMKIIVASWLFGGIFAVGLQVPQMVYLKTSCIVWPDVDGVSYLMLPKKISSCTAFPRFPVVISQVADIVLYCVTLVINLIVYARIITTLKRHASFDFGTGQRQHNKLNQVARLLITNGVIFFLCFTPWQFTNVDRIVTNLTGLHLFANSNHRYVRIVAILMSYVNSSINPFVYMTCSSTYRNAYRKAIGLDFSK